MQDTLAVLFLMLVAFQLKHFAADYPLQDEYMLRKFHSDPRIWIPALSAHAGVHALFTVFLVVVFMHGYPNMGFPLALALGAFDFVVHFTMDRIKASPKMLGRYKAMSAQDFLKAKIALADRELDELHRTGIEGQIRRNTYFWWALGFDQMVHHLTHYIIIACLIMH